MYNSNKKHFVLKQSSGKLWSFFHDERLGICCSTLSRRNSWSNPSSLKRNVHELFFADIDDSDRFHILFQDKQGNIHYLLIDNGSINITPVLNSKSPSLYDKHLRLIPFNNGVHFFYILEHNKSAMLAYQTITDGKVNTPKVVDYATQNNCPYSVVQDRSNSLYAFYQSSDGKYLQMGYKKYIPSQKFWSEFTPVTRHEGNCELPSTIIDNNGVIHICYQRRTPRQFELVYQQKIPDKNIWTNELVIHSSVHPFNESSILCLDENVVSYWVRDDLIYFSLSKDNGKTWSKPSKYNFPVGRQLMCISYRTNDTCENEKVSIDTIPGSFIRGLKMAFYQDIADNINNISENDLKNIILDTLKELKVSIDELRESDQNIRNEILKLSQAQQELEKELVKYSVKLKSVENEIGKLKSIDVNSVHQKNSEAIKKLYSQLAELQAKTNSEEDDNEE